MAAPSTNNKILILGGGLSGLALAQALKHHDTLPFCVYERDTLTNLRSQGYRIRIASSGASALKRLLPAHLWEAFDAMCGVVGQGMNKIDAVSGKEEKLFGGAGGPGVKMPASEYEDLVEGRNFNVDRAVARGLLLTGLKEGEEIVFGKEATGYSVLSESEGGGVEVRFKDGSVERGAFLVGADGSRSPTRRQMLSGLRILDTEARAIFGKTRVTDELREKMPSSMFDGITVTRQAGEARMMLFCDVMHFDRAATKPHEEKFDIRTPQDYIYWVIGFRKDILDDFDVKRELLHLSHAESKELSLAMTESWHDGIRFLFQEQATDTAATLWFLTTAPGFEQAWSRDVRNEAGSVAIMGDAAHPMPPAGGIGANTAWQDAYELFVALQAPQAKRADAVRGYEAKMLARAAKAVEYSSGGLGFLMGVKPLDQLKEAEFH